MRKNKIVISIIIGFFLMFHVACGTDNAVEREKTIPKEKSTAIATEEETDNKKTAFKQTKALEQDEQQIKFPLREEEYTITLHQRKKSEPVYEIRVWNEDQELLQQFPCEITSNQVELRCDDMNFDGSPDLEIIDSGQTEKEALGCLYLWDWEKEQFAEEGIAIPTQYELQKEHRVITVSTQDESSSERTILRVFSGMEQAVELRKWIFQKNAGILEIWDCVAKKSLFMGDVELNEDGTIAAEEYYQELFWEDLALFMDREASAAIPIVIEGETLEYPDKETLLTDCGFAGAEPFYQYYDRLGNLQLELYLDEETGKGCGICYNRWYTKECVPQVDRNGFVFDTCSAAEWEERDPFSMTSVTGTDGADMVKDYEEICEYTESGRIDYFRSQGDIDWLVEAGGLQKILEINFIYREDGTLVCKEYSHNSYMFATTFSYYKSFYDEKERLIYAEGYITHGSLEYYYIYTDNSKKPAYCLCLDWAGDCYPDMIKYKG